MRVRRDKSSDIEPAPADNRLATTSVRAAKHGARMADRVAGRVQALIAPNKHDPKNPPGPNKITHERTLGNFSVKTPFGTFNVTPSEMHQIRPLQGWEVIQVVDPDGTTGVELTSRLPFELPFGARVEVQTLGVYAGPSAGPIRVIGLGVTRDVIDAEAHEAGSVTVEFKLMGDDVARLAGMVAPGAVQKAAELLGSSAASGALGVVGDVLLGAVPIVSGLIALSTARWAIKTVKDPDAPRSKKVLAVAHAISDAVRVVFPIPGTVGNLALVGVALGVEWFKTRRAREPRSRDAAPSVLRRGGDGPPRPTPVARGGLERAVQSPGRSR